MYKHGCLELSLFAFCRDTSIGFLNNGSASLPSRTRQLRFPTSQIISKSTTDQVIVLILFLLAFQCLMAKNRDEPDGIFFNNEDRVLDCLENLRVPLSLFCCPGAVSRGSSNSLPILSLSSMETNGWSNSLLVPRAEDRIVMCKWSWPGPDCSLQTAVSSFDTGSPPRASLGRWPTLSAKHFLSKSLPPTLLTFLSILLILNDMDLNEPTMEGILETREAPPMESSSE
mmetsp:Transcript_11216/g.22399  ORF Transcript_11216/g.22399 Transcript_11216/m.22399 type:complete len:228 (+) Transcript_11216:2130-2813(+)